MEQREFGVGDWYATMAWGAWRPDGQLGRVVYLGDLVFFIIIKLAWIIACAAATFDMSRERWVALIAACGIQLFRAAVVRPARLELGHEDPTIDVRAATILSLAVWAFPVALRIGWQLAEGRPIGFR